MAVFLTDKRCDHSRHVFKVLKNDPDRTTIVLENFNERHVYKGTDTLVEYFDKLVAS